MISAFLAGIRRVHYSRAVVTLIAISMALPMVACGSREGQLNGEVFIVTKGGQNVRLGLVEVRLIPEKDIKAFVETKQTKAKEEMEKLRPQLAEAKAALETAERVEKEAGRVHDARFQESVAAAMGKGNYTEASERARAASDAWIKRIRDTGQTRSAYFTLVQRHNYFVSGKYYFEGLPGGTATTKTDADGKFSLTLNKKERYAVAAHGSRNIGDTTEEYYWLLWVSLQGNDSKRLLVSNDTLFEVRHPDGVVQVSGSL